MSRTRTIKVDGLARVEGEGALYVKVSSSRVEEVRLRIFEPPRFFEAFLRGRSFAEAPDITARICGICPVAYQMSAVHAMEDALGVHVDHRVRELRRLLYCGEWIESHTLHVALLHAPDFLGYEDAIQMAKDHRPEVERALALKKAGNEIIRTIGGREIHPVNVRVGGFYSAPARADLASLDATLARARDHAADMLRWVSTFDIPDLERDYDFVALRHGSEYPFNEGRLISNRGLDVAVRDFEEHIVEEHVPYSNALHATLEGHGAYLVGPMARYALNSDQLPPAVQQAAREAGLMPVCRNPFRSIIVRAVEVLYAVDEARRILAAYEPPEPAASPLPVHLPSATGFGCTEAPRGMLFHRYRLDPGGTIADARIIPPTSQNQKSIERDLAQFVGEHLELSKPALTWKCEQAIRNYDPCISCATHFLKLDIDGQP
jgi:coenzyme F420-reducing hydrogenase alpha subunit